MIKINGKTVKILRMRMGLSKVDFEKQFGISRKTLYKIENSLYANVKEETIIKLSNIFKVKIEVLLNDN